MILVDNRKGSAELADLIKSPTQLTRLDFGDFAFLGNGPEGPVNVGIERKTIPDLVNSITSGRLSGYQLIGLQNCYNYIYLLVEGIWRQGEDGLLEILRGRGWSELSLGRQTFTAREINNYLNTLSVFCGICVWQTPNIRSSARWISDLFNWWSKDWDKHKAHKAFHTIKPVTVSLTPPTIMQCLAKEFPDVGWEKGKLIAERYKTTLELSLASEAELMEIPGIGRKTAKKIIQITRGE